MKFLKRFCPKCGAKAGTVTGDYDEFLSFKCGSESPIHGTEISTQSDICRELCQLREKKAEGLTWEVCDDGLKAFSFFGRRYLILLSKHGADLLNPGTGFWTNLPTLDAAKAHAEELHQQAWRELRTKWDAV